MIYSDKAYALKKKLWRNSYSQSRKYESLYNRTESYV